GLIVTQRTGFNQTDIDPMKASRRNVASVIADLIAFYLARQRERHGLDVAPMHGVCAVVPYADATLLYVYTPVWRSSLPARTRGTTLCDLVLLACQTPKSGRHRMP